MSCCIAPEVCPGHVTSFHGSSFSSAPFYDIDNRGKGKAGKVSYADVAGGTKTGVKQPEGNSSQPDHRGKRDYYSINVQTFMAGRRVYTNCVY